MMDKNRFLFSYLPDCLAVAQNLVAWLPACLQFVGSDEALGSWDAHKAPALSHQGSDVWARTLMLPPGLLEFKVLSSMAVFERQVLGLLQRDPKGMPLELLLDLLQYTTTNPRFDSSPEELEAYLAHLQAQGAVAWEPVLGLVSNFQSIPLERLHSVMTLTMVSP
ncbi:hypothetical protein HaLaN_15733, partial [Haematococcus lacustris]